MRRYRVIAFFGLWMLVLMGCAPSGPSLEEVLGPLSDTPTLSLRSPAFEDGDIIPDVYTCEGEDISPPLAWGDVPPDTESLALIMEDPDAPRGTWVHWVVYNIAAASRSLPEGVPAGRYLETGVQQGKNGWSNHEYGGPCPPSGMHRYVFNLYALDTVPDLDPEETTKSDLLAAMKGHVLAWGRLMGEYQR